MVGSGLTEKANDLVVVPRMKREPRAPVSPAVEVEITPGEALRASRSWMRPWFSSSTGSSTVTAEVTVEAGRGTRSAETMSDSSWFSSVSAWTGRITARDAPARALRTKVRWMDVSFMCLFSGCVLGTKRGRRGKTGSHLSPVLFRGGPRTRFAGKPGGRVTSNGRQVFGLPVFAPPAFTVYVETIGLVGFTTGYRSATAPEFHRIP